MATQRVTPFQKIADRAQKLVYGTRINAPVNAIRAEASMLLVAVMAATRRAAAIGRLEHREHGHRRQARENGIRGTAIWDPRILTGSDKMVGTGACIKL
ncbi:hypothetical protein HZS_3995 [Henneguya salminicola]|nr:hypothetical protein HZS_3995 [Henneguya salminicola]